MTRMHLGSSCSTPKFRIHLAFLCFGLLLQPTVFASNATDTLVIGKTVDPLTIDPAVTFDTNDWTITYPAYQKLMRYQEKDGKGLTSIEGDLAQSWTTSADGLIWEFKLKPGNKFDDGAAVDADAVKFSFDRLMRLKRGPSGAFPDDMQVNVVDPMTVRFTLSKPYAPFVFTLATNGAGIVNPNISSKGDADAYLSNHTAGSGPFRLAEWKKGQSLTMLPNSHFAGPKPVLNKVVIRIIGESSVRRLQLEHDDLDIVENMPEDQLDGMQGKPGVTVFRALSQQVSYLYLNNGIAPLSNPDVRRAIVSAIDYEGIVSGILKNKSQRLTQPIPTGMWGNDPSIIAVTQDLISAKAALAKSGQSVKTLTFMYSDKDPTWETIGLTIQANLAELGINLRLEKLANAPMRERLDKGDFDISIGYWTPDFSDPFMYMNYWFDSSKNGLAGNRSFYHNAKVDELIRKSASLSDVEERTRLYQQAQKIVIDEAAYAYLYQKNYSMAMRDSVKGFVFNPMLEQVFNIGSISK